MLLLFCAAPHRAVAGGGCYVAGSYWNNREMARGPACRLPPYYAAIAARQEPGDPVKNLLVWTREYEPDKCPTLLRYGFTVLVPV